jgi:hypothetical protein
MSGSNHETGPSVRGTNRRGVKLCQRCDKVEKLRDQWYLDYGILGFMDDVKTRVIM